MPPKKRKTQSEQTNQPTTVASVFIPERQRAKHTPVGVEQQPDQPRKRVMRPEAAGSESPLFPKGGRAFRVWCKARGITAREKRSAEEWEGLLQEFADRPIHGLRRGPDGGNHRPNPSALK